MKRPGLMIAAPCSGSGKTTFTTGLLAALSARGETVYAYKCGPDYIDPMYHTAALGVPSRNLDTFFTDEEMTRRLYLEDPDPGCHIVEGVMGLYDGVAGTEETGSSYDLARVLGLPILLVVNARGQGRSLIALLKGFQALDHADLIRGVVLNQISGEMYARLAPLIEEGTGLACLGYLPKEEGLTAPGRHLGLLAPGELPDTYICKVRETVERQLDWERFFRILNSAERPKTGAEAENVNLRESVGASAPAAESASGRTGTGGESGREAVSEHLPETMAEHGTETVSETATEPLRLAVARDAAFSFCYTDNLRMLERAGAELIYFSPLTDPHLPEDCDGLLLSGGYPELSAKQLSENQNLLREIRAAVTGGLPTVAECGGFLYLQQTLKDPEGHPYQMAGALPGTAEDKKHPVRFGYVTLWEKEPLFLPEGTVCRGHEFHYYDSTENGSSCHVEKPVTGRSWDAVVTTETLWAGFPHVYYPACPAFVTAFVSKMRACRERKLKQKEHEAPNN